MDAVVKPLTAVIPIVSKPGVDVAPDQLIELTPEVLGWKFASVDTETLTDQIARANRFMGALEKWVKAAKVAYLTRLPVPLRGLPVVTQGKEFMSVYSAMERADIDREAVKKDMGEEWYTAHCKTTSYVQVSFKPLQPTQTSVAEEEGEEG